MRKYRPLHTNEIQQLESQSCRAETWTSIQVTEDFSADNIHHTYFSGQIYLSRFTKMHTLEGGMKKPAGIYYAHIHQCSLHEDVLIMNVSGGISNYEIGKEVLISGLHLLAVDGKSHFGNGVKSHVLNETGGREVILYNHLSAQVAYILAMYRHRPQITSELTRLINLAVDQTSDHIGKIGAYTKIKNCGTIKGVYIGEGARLNNVLSLENGSINSNLQAPVKVGSGVVARDFILSSGAIVTDGAQLTRCFVGQASHIGHLFSAHDSLLFSNCQMENGEACAVFAGPYCVSMHKSSLLIAALYSFLNAGSGFNQSNHMYKLGPIHQGIVERGGRMASDSYILWPARVGPFTMVMGRHTQHLDTSIFPFSYLIQSEGNSFLMPGANLTRVGTVRDAYKWPNRDKRTDSQQLDSINFDLLSPYTIGKIQAALSELKSIQHNSPDHADFYFWKGAKIKPSSMLKGREQYEKAIHRYLGNTLIKKIQAFNGSTIEELCAFLSLSAEQGLGAWVDLSGMLAPKDEVDRLLEDLEKGAFHSIQEFEEAIRGIHQNYAIFEWNWTKRFMEQYYNMNLANVTKQQILKWINLWFDAMQFFDRELLKDASKEFQESSQIGYGVDDISQLLSDFEAVRGSFGQQDFVKQIKEHLITKKVLFETIQQKIALLS